MSAPEVHRLFIGTALDPVPAASLTRMINAVLEDNAWRMAPVAQWHVTTLFIGERHIAQLERIKEVVAGIAADVSPIGLSSGRLVTMPANDPTMLWVRFEPDARLTALHHAMAAALQAPPSPFTPHWPHVTLARTRRAVIPIHEGPIVIEELTIPQLTLFSTRPGPQGSIHEPLDTWRLSGKGPAGPLAAV